jgi:hypothetical protein
MSVRPPWQPPRPVPLDQVGGGWEGQPVPGRASPFAEQPLERFPAIFQEVVAERDIDFPLPAVVAALPRFCGHLAGTGLPAARHRDTRRWLAGFARGSCLDELGGKGLFSPKPPFISSLFRYLLKTKPGTLSLVAKTPLALSLKAIAPKRALGAPPRFVYDHPY